jgi:hypothetical protein
VWDDEQSIKLEARQEAGLKRYEVMAVFTQLHKVKTAASVRKTEMLPKLKQRK